jgi:hypothetical protein
MVSRVLAKLFSLTGKVQVRLMEGLRWLLRPYSFYQLAFSMWYGFCAKRQLPRPHRQRARQYFGMGVSPYG